MSHAGTLERLEELGSLVSACRSLAARISGAADLVAGCLLRGCTVFSCGNGGSACDAMHLTEELVGRYRTNRKALPAVCLNADPAVLTCISNDWDYASVFSRQLEALGREGDLLVAFSSTGNSSNLIAAIEAARQRKMDTVALLGKDGGRMAGTATCEIIVPSQNTARVQEIHTWILHEFLETVERRAIP